MSRRLPSLKPIEVIRILERNGFWKVPKRRKHRIVPVPYHNRDLKLGTLRGIIQQAGWTVEEFVEKL